MLEQLLARLNVDGTIKKASSPETAGANKVVLTGYDGLIDPSLVPLGVPTLGSITAAKITYDNTHLPAGASLQVLLDTFNGTPNDYFLKVENHLGEFDAAQQAAAFSYIKQAGTTEASGVVYKATYDQTLDYHDDGDGEFTPYSVAPKTANYRYLIKNNGNPDTSSDVAVATQTLQGLIGYTSTLSDGLSSSAATTLVSKAYVDSKVSTTLNVQTPRIFWVSPSGTDGADITKYCSLTYPYASIKQALTKATLWRSTPGVGATTPITVVVMPGEHTISDTDNAALAASYINLHFMPGAKITYSGSGGNPLFSFTDATPGFSVTGYGEFYLTASTSSGVVVASGGSPTKNTAINFECQSITTSIGKAINLTYPSDTGYYLSANIKIRGDITNTSNSVAAILLDQNIRTQIVVEGTLLSNNKGISFGSGLLSGCTASIHNIVLNDMSCTTECLSFEKIGDVTVTANKLYTSGGAATVFNSATSGSAIVQANRILAATNYCVHCAATGGSSLLIKDALVSCADATNPLIYLTTTNGRLTLKNLDLVAASGPSTLGDTITASVGAGNSAAVYLLGYTRSNNAAHTDVIFTGGVYDYVA